MQHKFYADIRGGRKACIVFGQRLDLLGHLGISPIKIGDICHKLDYPQYVIDIIVSTDENDLFENCNESWHLMRCIVEKFSDARLRDRDCYHTAKDLCADALLTDVIFSSITRLFPGFDFKKNGQDRAFELLPSVSLEPDFVAGNAKLEMKIAKTAVDDTNRSNWSNQTFTLRPYDLQSQLFDYRPFRPLYFLRINYETKVFAIIGYDEFRPSYSRDGSYFARIKPIEIKPSLKEFAKSLHGEIQRKILLRR